MCVRITQPAARDLQIVRERLAVDFDYGDIPLSPQPVTAVAGRQNLIIVADSKIPTRPGRMMTTASWGIGLSQGFTYNARLEGIASKPTWRDPWRNHRVIVPAGSFFERQNKDTWYELQTYAEKPFFLAGIAVKDLNDGKRKVVICTYPTNDEVKFVHSRMPVVVPPSLIHEWFNPEVNSDELIHKLQVERTRFKVTKGTMQPLRGAA